VLKRGVRRLLLIGDCKCAMKALLAYIRLAEQAEQNSLQGNLAGSHSVCCGMNCFQRSLTRNGQTDLRFRSSMSGDPP
jgi:hypothetical protein